MVVCAMLLVSTLSRVRVVCVTAGGGVRKFSTMESGDKGRRGSAQEVRHFPSISPLRSCLEDMGHLKGP